MIQCKECLRYFEPYHLLPFCSPDCEKWFKACLEWRETIEVRRKTVKPIDWKYYKWDAERCQWIDKRIKLTDEQRQQPLFEAI